jgi:transglutaminase-like putative cysteine protease
VLVCASAAAPVALTTTGPIARVVALFLAAAAAALRLGFPVSDAVALVAFALGAGSLVVTGQEKIGWPFALAAVAFVGLSLASADGAGGARAGRRERLAAAAVVALACALGGAGALAIPRLQGALEAVLGRFFLDDDTPTTGFSDELRLGSMRSLLKSDEVALRVFGARTDYLRGVVYDAYDRGRWRTPTPSGAHTLGARAPGAAEVVVEQRSGRAFFLPLGACGVGTADGPLAADATGIVSMSNGARAARAWFDPSCRVASAPVIAPREADLTVPPDVRPAAASAAERWTAGAASPLEKAERIEERLRTGFRYSLDVERDPRIDPVVDFLEEHAAGHCEYFASAMALVARSAGLPARVVGGYRVGERNPVGGWWVARERNAHAWVEVWVDGAWRTFDPTPAAAVDPAREAGLVGGLLDLAARAWERATPRELFEVGLSIAAALGAWLAALRLWRRVRSRGPQLAGPPVPASFARLQGALARLGHARPPWEPIEDFAARLEAERVDPSARDAAELLRRYARHRYGGEGDDASLARDVDRFVTGRGGG